VDCVGLPHRLWKEVVGEYSVRIVLGFIDEKIKSVRDALKMKENLVEFSGGKFKDSVSMQIDRVVIDLLEYAKKAVVEEAKRRGLI